MSATAVYCGTKRSYVEDIPSPPSSKRFRCYSPSSNSLTWSSPSSSLHQLRTAFPNLEQTVLVKALEEHASDLNAAMKSLHYLVLSSAEEKKHENLAVAGGTYNNPPTSGDDWVELIVREVSQSTGKDDAKVRAARVLEALEKMLTTRVREEVEKRFQEEHVAVQQQLESLTKDNTVLKRAVAIQHERHKASSIDDANHQLQLLMKNVIPQYQEKLRTLEVKNYSLRMHLQEVEHGKSMPGRFNPDVF